MELLSGKREIRITQLAKLGIDLPAELTARSCVFQF